MSGDPCVPFPATQIAIAIQHGNAATELGLSSVNDDHNLYRNYYSNYV